VTAVILSGGVGKRMGAKIPKQYLKLLGLEIALHSLDTFIDCDVIAEIVIVVADEYKYVFEEHIAKRGVKKPVHYTNGGAERQDSVQNGLAKATSEFVAVHDAARPLVTVAEVEKVIADAEKCGAALLAVNTKATIKQASTNADGEPVVEATPNRKLLWEAHTPQVIRCELLREGFENAAAKDLAVTDDVSLIEALGKPVKITEGEYTNLKVTTPEDMSVAEAILRERGYEAAK
jgi:2-C-methyl-D-erythritol 4-phosphate cytidylyltransferase